MLFWSVYTGVGYPALGVGYPTPSVKGALVTQILINKNIVVYFMNINMKIKM